MIHSLFIHFPVFISQTSWQLTVITPCPKHPKHCFLQYMLYILWNSKSFVMCHCQKWFWFILIGKCSGIFTWINYSATCYSTFSILPGIPIRCSWGESSGARFSVSCGITWWHIQVDHHQSWYANSAHEFWRWIMGGSKGTMWQDYQNHKLWKIWLLKQSFTQYYEMYSHLYTFVHLWCFPYCCLEQSNHHQVSGYSWELPGQHRAEQYWFQPVLIRHQHTEQHHRRQHQVGGNR